MLEDVEQQLALKGSQNTSVINCLVGTRAGLASSAEPPQPETSVACIHYSGAALHISTIILILSYLSQPGTYKATSWPL